MHSVKDITNRIENFLPSSTYKELETFLKAHWGYFIKNQYMSTPVGDPVLYFSDRIHGNTIRSFGYCPSLLSVAGDLSQKCGESWLQPCELGTFNFDISNCGIMHIHFIQNRGIKGLGVRVLRTFEEFAVATRRKYLVASVSERQGDGHRFMLRHGYEVNGEFIGGNSGNKCYTLVKDLVKNPSKLVKIHPIHTTEVKEKKEPKGE